MHVHDLDERRVANHPVSDSAFLSDTSSDANDKKRVSD